MMALVAETSAVDGIEATCAALGLCRATYHRSLEPATYGPVQRARSPRALCAEETRDVLDVLHED